MQSSARSRRSGATFVVRHSPRRPPAALRSLVELAYVTELPRESVRDFTFERLPDAAVHVYFRAEPTTLDGATIRVEGLDDRLRTYDREPASATLLIGVELEVGAARQVLGVPAAALKGLSLSLEDLWGRRAREVVERMLDARTTAAREGVFADALAERARSADPPPPSLRGALRAIEETYGRVRIAEVAASAGVSARQLQRQFTTEVGVSPKRYARITRLRRLLQWHGDAPFSWAERAAELHYADQAHLIADFRALMRAPPERLLGEGDFVAEHLRAGWLLTPRVSDFHKTRRDPIP